jgi:hypothetical protein
MREDLFNKRVRKIADMRDLYKMLEALKTFHNWARPDLPPYGITSYGHRVSRDSVVVSREKVRLSDDIFVITFYGRFEYRFTPSLAAQLQQVLAQYGSLQAAA